MTREPFQISDGRRVTPHKHHDDKWMLDGKRVTVAEEDGDVVVVDEVGHEIHRGPVQRDGCRSGKTTASGKSDSSRGDAAARFVTFNTFVDQVMRGLTPVETLVWIVAFRDCRNGQSSTSSSDLATRTGCSLRAVKAAVRALCEVGLMTPITLSRHKGQASIYAVATRPHLCVPKLPARARRQRSATGANGAPVGSDTN